LIFRNPFWRTTAVVLVYKRQLALAMLGALISALCFGSGLAMILPVLHLLLNNKQKLDVLITQYLANPDRPQIIQELGQWLAAHVSTDPFWAFLVVMAVILTLTIVGSTGRYIHQLLTITVIAKAVVSWRNRLFHRLIRAQMGVILQTGYADHISKIAMDTRVLGRGMTEVLGKAAAKILNGAAALSVALWLDWRLTLIALIGAPVIFVLLRKFGKRVRRASRKMMQHRGRMVAMLNESFGGISVIKVHQAEGYERRRFDRLAQAVFSQEMRKRQAQALTGPVVETLGLTGVIVVASVAAWYIFRLNVPAERFMTVLAALAGAAASLKPLSTMNNRLQEASAAADRILSVMDTPIESTADRRTRSLPPLPRHHRDIVFDAVCYTYPNQPSPAVDAVSLEVRFGQTVAIVGPNGSGKTTLLSLLPHLLTPMSGRVLIDGTDTNDVRLSSLRRQIAVVTQQLILFEATIAQNIAYSRPHIPMDQIIAAAKTAHAHEFIVDLPQGYDTMLSEGGHGLSGGQKQRVCIARAILRDPAILILDEATSQIDADSEAKINMVLRSFCHGRTTFVIAHRLSTVIDADLIVVMVNGKIIDQGQHAQLLDRCEAYRTLTRNQLQPSSA